MPWTKTPTSSGACPSTQSTSAQPSACLQLLILHDCLGVDEVRPACAQAFSLREPVAAQPAAAAGPHMAQELSREPACRALKLKLWSFKKPHMRAFVRLLLYIRTVGCHGRHCVAPRTSTPSCDCFRGAVPTASRTHLHATYLTYCYIWGCSHVVLFDLGALASVLSHFTCLQWACASSDIVMMIPRVRL